jgi:heme exporter protein D
MIPEIQEYLRMGGYAFYVWSAYGISFMVLVLNVIVPLWREKRITRSIAIRSQQQS